MATGGRDGTVKLWDVLSGAERRTLRGHTKLVKSLAFAPDGRHLLSGSWDWTAKLWDVSTGQVAQTLSGHGAALSAVARTGGCGRKITLLLQRTPCASPLARVTMMAGGGWRTPHPGGGPKRLVDLGHV